MEEFRFGCADWQSSEKPGIKGRPAPGNALGAGSTKRKPAEKKPGALIRYGPDEQGVEIDAG
jgi:hypothetical protein